MARVVSTADEFTKWLRFEAHIRAVMYFAGDMARFRKNAEQAIRTISRLRRKTPAQAYTLDKIRAQLALIDEARWQARMGNVHLIQRRGGAGWVYLAKRARELKRMEHTGEFNAPRR